MAGSAYISKRTTSQGDRYDVIYRQGGAAFAKKRAGVFHSRKDAITRRDMIRGWFAQGKDPEIELQALGRQAVDEKKIRELWPEYVSSRKDVSESRRAGYGHAWAHVEPILGHLSPGQVTVEDGMRLVTAMERKVKASTVELYFKCARQFLDAYRDPNPLRSKHIRLPRELSDEVVAMSYEEWMVLRATVRDTKYGKNLALAMDFIEAGGFRLGDAKQLTSGDIDFFEGRVRISKARGKSTVSRWVPVPRPILDELKDRDGIVFPELSKHDLPGIMRRSCERAGLRHYHPHDLRHRRASLWIAQGVPVTTVGQWIGHTDLTTTLRVYAHVVASPKDLWKPEDYKEAVNA